MLVLVFVIAALCAAGPAQAQMTPLTDERHVEANVQYQGRSDHQAQDPPGFFQA